MADKPKIPDFPNLPDFGQMITQACEVVASVRGIPYDFNGTLSLENKFVVLFKTVKEMFDAHDELVKSYKALYDFVNQYFTNLDVQEEINNKLDEMASNGKLLEFFSKVSKYIYITDIDNTGNTDVTEKINDTLNNMQSGGIFLKEGKYLIEGKIKIPPYCGIYGFKSADMSNNKGGTVLLMKNNGQILVNMGSTVSGITFYYPEQKFISSPIEYKPTITTESSGIWNVVLEDLFFINPYIAISIDVNHSKFRLRNITGYSIFKGIVLKESRDIDFIENVHFNYNTITLGQMQIAANRYAEWTRNNGTFIEIDNSDWSYIYDSFCYGYKTAIKTSGSNGTKINNCGFDGCGIIFDVQSSQCLISNNTITQLNQFDDVTEDYFAILKSGRILYNSNVHFNCNRGGIDIKNQWCCISNNIFYQSSDSSSNFSVPFILNEPKEGITQITGNMFTFANKHDIIIDCGSSACNIISNVFNNGKLAIKTNNKTSLISNYYSYVDKLYDNEPLQLLENNTVNGLTSTKNITLIGPDREDSPEIVFGSKNTRMDSYNGVVRIFGERDPVQMFSSGILFSPKTDLQNIGFPVSGIYSDGTDLYYKNTGGKVTKLTNNA